VIRLFQARSSKDIEGYFGDLISDGKKIRVQFRKVGWKAGGKLYSPNAFCPFAHLWVGYCQEGTSDKYYAVGFRPFNLSPKDKIYTWYGRRYALGGSDVQESSVGSGAFNAIIATKEAKGYKSLDDLEGTSFQIVRYPDGLLLATSSSGGFYTTDKAMQFGDYFLVSPKIITKDNEFQIKAWGIFYRYLGRDGVPNGVDMLYRVAHPREEIAAGITRDVEKRLLAQLPANTFG